MKKLKTSFSKISVVLVSMTILATGLWACNSDDTATSNNTTTEKTVMSAKTEGEELPSFEEWQEMISIHKQTSE